MGSVKDLVVIEKTEKNKTGKAQFVFSDRYSIFDWGEMPEHIQAKGASLCITTAYFFEKLEENKDTLPGIGRRGGSKKVIGIKIAAIADGDKTVESFKAQHQRKYL